MRHPFTTDLSNLMYGLANGPTAAGVTHDATRDVSGVNDADCDLMSRSDDRGKDHDAFDADRVGDGGHDHHDVNRNENDTLNDNPDTSTDDAHSDHAVFMRDDGVEQ